MHAVVYTVFLLCGKDKNVTIVTGMGYFENLSTNKHRGEKYYIINWNTTNKHIVMSLKRACLCCK